VNHCRESRVREIRQHGLAGGGADFNRSSLPRSPARPHWPWPKFGGRSPP